MNIEEKRKLLRLCASLSRRIKALGGNPMTRKTEERKLTFPTLWEYANVLFIQLELLED